ncbi:unnamed protein product [Brassica oleracea var. botrytis]
MIHNIDTNRDGCVDIYEFESLYRSIVNEHHNDGHKRRRHESSV